MSTISVSTIAAAIPEHFEAYGDFCGQIDSSMNNIENGLSDIALYPGLGTVAGSVKVIVGAAQSLTALVCGIFALLYGVFTHDLSPASFAWSHVKHGGGNIVAGVLEAIPVVGTAVHIFRSLDPGSDALVHLYTGHENKWMPYERFFECDWRFDGVDGEEGDSVRQAYQTFHQEVEKRGGRDQVSSAERFAIAQAIVPLRS